MVKLYGVIKSALKLNSRDNRYYEKNVEDISKYSALALQRLNRLKLN